MVDVIIYRSAEKENQKNRGFAFLEYDSHKSASTAKRKLSTGRLKVWNCDVIVDWADPVDNPDDETMSKVCRKDIIGMAIGVYMKSCLKN